MQRVRTLATATFLATCLGFVSACPGDDPAQCRSDADCRGDRICSPEGCRLPAVDTGLDAADGADEDGAGDTTPVDTAETSTDGGNTRETETGPEDTSDTSDGGSSCTPGSCPDSLVCRDGACREARVCEPDATFCEGDTLMACNGDGTSASEQKECASGCSDGSCRGPCSETGDSQLGCQFYAVDLDNYATECQSDSDCVAGAGAGRCRDGVCSGTNANAAQFAVQVTNPSDREASVDILDGMETQVASATVGADSSQIVELDPYNVTESSRSERAYQISTDRPVSVHQINPRGTADIESTGTSLLTPTDTLGTDYVVNGWPTMDVDTSGDRVPSTRSYVTVVATETGDTTVDVTTPVAIASGDGVPDISPGSSQSFTLEHGEVLQLMISRSDGKDPAGIEVSGSQKLAVFSGSEAVEIPEGTNYLSHVEEQLAPVSAWGTDYVVGKFAPRGTEDDVVRVVASENATSIQTTPSTSADGTTLSAGEVVQFRTDRPVSLTANKPVDVQRFTVGSDYAPDGSCGFDNESGCAIERTCQTSTGTDSRIGAPSSLYQPPTAHYRREYAFANEFGFEENWVEIVAKMDTQVTLDGQTATIDGQSIGDSDWRIYHRKVDAGHHRVSADGPVGVAVYGYGCDNGYAHPAGFDF